MYKVNEDDGKQKHFQTVNEEFDFRYDPTVIDEIIDTLYHRAPTTTTYTPPTTPKIPVVDCDRYPER